VHRVNVGAARLQLEHFAAQDGTVLFPGTAWWDSEGEHDCGARLFADGTTRCVQVEVASSEDLFADDACSVPAYAFFAGGCNPAPDAARVRAETELIEAQCATVITKLIELQRHTAAVYSNADGCAEMALDPSQVVFVDGDEIPAETYPELRVVSP
jgi:hypothetical protein